MFDDIQVGDKVIYYPGRLGRSEVVVCVRITPTQIVCKTNPDSKFSLNFHKKNGNLVGRGSWSTSRIAHYTEEDAQRIRDNKEQRELEQYFKNWADSRPWAEWDLERMRQVKAYLDQTTKKED